MELYTTVFYFATVDQQFLRTTNQFLRPSNCQKGSPNKELEEVYTKST